MAYDKNNVFAKILKGEIPAKKIYEDEFALAFHDIDPKAPVHVLVIPKGEYQNWEAFALRASPECVVGFVRAVAVVSKLVDPDAKGHRLLVNNGANAGQEVPHLHVHILGGEPLGPLLGK